MLLPPNLSAPKNLASCVQHLLLYCEAANVLEVFVTVLPVLDVLCHSAFILVVQIRDAKGGLLSTYYDLAIFH